MSLNNLESRGMNLPSELIKLDSQTEEEKELLNFVLAYISLAVRLEEYGILRSIPGANTAVRMIAEIGDIRRCDNNRQLNAYTGIDIRRYQSGKFIA